jgi:hypothetical protein
MIKQAGQTSKDAGLYPMVSVAEMQHLVQVGSLSRHAPGHQTFPGYGVGVVKDLFGFW